MLNPHFYFDASERVERIQEKDCLDLDDNEMCVALVERERREYIRWVNKVVDSHRGSDLEDLVIVFCLDARHSLLLDNWISFALKKNVKAIKINLPTSCFEKVTRCSFLRSAHVTSGIESLTSLCLEYVDITGEIVEHLLSVCPLLERLSLREPEDLLNLKVVGPSRKLKYSSIIWCLHLRSLEIYAPKLVSFTYFGSRTTTLQVKGLCFLVDLCFYITGNMAYTLRDFFRFSQYFSQLETLTLDFDYDELRFSVGREVLLGSGNLRAHQYLKVVEMSEFVGRNLEVEIAKFFLKNVTNLEKLIIYLARDENGEYDVLDGSRETAEELRGEVPPGVELLIL